MSRPQLNSERLSGLWASLNNQEDVLHNAPSEIIDNFLFLGDVANATSLSQLQHFGISNVLSVLTHSAFGSHDGIERLFLNIRDVEDENIAMFFDPACEFIEHAKASGGRVLVHCMAGKSRSATLVIVYIMRSLRMHLNDAFHFVKMKRSIVFPNVGFWQQLMEEELKLFGSQSPIPNGYTVLMDIHKGILEMSPKKLFKQYLLAAALEDASRAAEEKRRTLDEWTVGWPASKSIEDVFVGCIENLRSDARIVAVEFISDLHSRKHFTSAEVAEGFALLQAMPELDELRLDVPKIDEYIAEMVKQAENLGLLKF